MRLLRFRKPTVSRSILLCYGQITYLNSLLPFGRFSLDFAWPHKKLCIEIDGEQHQRFADYKARDERKDAELEKAGWKVLRLSWREVCAEPKKYIYLANEFISGGGVMVTTA